MDPSLAAAEVDEAIAAMIAAASATRRTATGRRRRSAQIMVLEEEKRRRISLSNGARAATSWGASTGLSRASRGPLGQGLAQLVAGKGGRGRLRVNLKVEAF